MCCSSTALAASSGISRPPSVVVNGAPIGTPTWEDLGAAVKGFRKGMEEPAAEEEKLAPDQITAEKSEQESTPQEAREKELNG